MAENVHKSNIDAYRMVAEGDHLKLFYIYIYTFIYCIYIIRERDWNRYFFYDSWALSKWHFPGFIFIYIWPADVIISNLNFPS